MCMMVYVALDKPLPLVVWDESNPSFNVHELTERDEAVRKHFSKPYVYYLGAHTGYSCGFSYSPYDRKEEEKAAGRVSVRCLSAYLSQAIDIAGPVELYACWDGDQGEEPEFREVLNPQQIGGEAFGFEERQFINMSN